MPFALPTDMCALILDRLDARGLVALSGVCHEGRDDARRILGIFYDAAASLGASPVAATPGEFRAVRDVDGRGAAIVLEGRVDANRVEIFALNYLALPMCIGCTWEELPLTGIETWSSRAVHHPRLRTLPLSRVRTFVTQSHGDLALHSRHVRVALLFVTHTVWFKVSFGVTLHLVALEDDPTGVFLSRAPVVWERVELRTMRGV